MARAGAPRIARCEQNVWRSRCTPLCATRARSAALAPCVCTIFCVNGRAVGLTQHAFAAQMSMSLQRLRQSNRSSARNGACLLSWPSLVPSNPTVRRRVAASGDRRRSTRSAIISPQRRPASPPSSDDQLGASTGSCPVASTQPFVLVEVVENRPTFAALSAAGSCTASASSTPHSIGLLQQRVQHRQHVVHGLRRAVCRSRFSRCTSSVLMWSSRRVTPDAVSGAVVRPSPCPRCHSASAGWRARVRR